MARIIDSDKGVSSETMTIDEFNKRGGMPEITGVNTVKIYSVVTKEPRNYCHEHHGAAVIDNNVYEWYEDCECE